MKGNLLPCLRRVTFPIEGLFNASPKEPGGGSMRGVSMETLREYYKHCGRKPPTMANLKALSEAGATLIYQWKYAAGIHFDELPIGVDCVALDFSINLGIGGMTNVLRKALDVGAQAGWPSILSRAEAVDHIVLIHRIRDLWLAAKRTQIEAAGSSWSKYERGLTKRGERTVSIALDMAAKGKPDAT